MKKGPAVKIAIDLALWSIALVLAFWFRVEHNYPRYYTEIVMLTLVGLPAKAIIVWYLGLFRRSWHRSGMRDVTALAAGVAVYTIGFALLALLPSNLAIPRSVPIIEGMIAMLLLTGARVAARYVFEEKTHLANGGRKSARRVIIAGAGEAGVMIAREMLRNPQSKHLPIGFIDDDPSKRRQRFVGLKVLGGIEELPAICRMNRADEVLIAMPSQPGEVVRRVVELAQESKVDSRIIPGVYELISGNVTISQIREVDVEDLLRRKAVRLETQEIASYVRNKRILVTGAGGSIGSEIVRQLTRFNPDELLLLGRGENSIYQIERELARMHPEIRRRAFIVDVRDYSSLEHVFRSYRPQVVFHAAAHKHVPLMEDNPEQAIFNNVGGTRNLVELALAYDVKRFVNVSTDKAVNPTSIMGASKRVAEIVVRHAAEHAPAGSAFVSVRFGNVLGSRGSVIPLFKEQIRRGGPVTVTHPEMKRYFMTIPEASQLVLQAGALGDNGSVYVLDMGEPVKIVDLARDLIRLSGFKPGVDIEVRFSGARPGEKLFEELLTAEEGTVASRHEKIFVARKNGVPSEELDVLLDRLFEAGQKRDRSQIFQTLDRLIPVHELEGLKEEMAAA